MVNRQEVFRRRRTASTVVLVAQTIAQMCAFVSLVAGFWHIWWVAGVGMLVTGIVAVGVHSAGYTRLELDQEPTHETPMNLAAARRNADGFLRRVRNREECR